ncbi:uncharacterized protein KY384_006763 [Bacidia gigantensis]|uniref:uncharacterized protein n=1 Tax=Bacidia gigantensis TaxID=2732470 RepID=UPI001D056CCD|nr:uncharacterized protein KY384_006763 [Bacidia gigantensis]KAG8527847.1 hypothetical protein KY384_006763 [Bacidia gigantensis]
MPLPPEPITLHGGCNCGQIRYRIAIPALSSRPLHPNYHSSSSLEPVHQPFIFTDHCNDCRRASGSILPAWISAPLDMVSGSIASSDWKPAREVFTTKSFDQPPKEPGSDDKEGEGQGIRGGDGRLGFYQSTPGRWRTFCAMCGTPLTYWEEGTPSMDGVLDLQLGTVDRRDLDSEALRPERHLWWELGVGWVKGYVDHGDGMGEGKSVERHQGDSMDVRLGRGPNFTPRVQVEINMPEPKNARINRTVSSGDRPNHEPHKDRGTSSGARRVSSTSRRESTRESTPRLVSISKREPSGGESGSTKKDRASEIPRCSRPPQQHSPSQQARHRNGHKHEEPHVKKHVRLNSIPTNFEDSQQRQAIAGVDRVQEPPHLHEDPELTNAPRFVSCPMLNQLDSQQPQIPPQQAPNKSQPDQEPSDSQKESKPDGIVDPTLPPLNPFPHNDNPCPTNSFDHAIASSTDALIQDTFLYFKETKQLDREKALFYQDYLALRERKQHLQKEQGRLDGMRDRIRAAALRVVQDVEWKEVMEGMEGMPGMWEEGW